LPGSILSKKSKAKQDVPLDVIVAAPDRYADQEITPKGVYRLGRHLSHGLGGTPTVEVIEGGLMVKQLAPVSFVVVPTVEGRTSTLEVDPSLAGKLRAIQSSPGSTSGAGWENYVAILTLRVVRAEGLSRGTAWVCRIVKAEFLVNLDPLRIGEHKFARSFETYTITPQEEGIGVGDGEDWQKRLGIHAIASIGKAGRAIHTQLSLMRENVARAAVANAVNQSIQQAAAANAAREAAQRRAMSPGPVNGRAVFRQGVNLGSAP
jgi:hypothetical protein